MSVEPWYNSHSIAYNDIMPSILISKHVPHQCMYEVSALRSLAIFTVLLTMRTWEGGNEKIALDLLSLLSLHQKENKIIEVNFIR